ncbi:hypothetical protein EXIGLDRAFT_777034 [Exidia glandulosa HHB12029]|uniref:F-box domain-containing protein n=1 Tax=Exidia glandulosa HHB12029 TaxID=1314781 RepID=A0A165D8F6_EXIGL|nr:hypothetical protein EXIGLDRAFT_777034 [Exidia glandulosa HHB12029]
MSVADLPTELIARIFVDAVQPTDHHSVDNGTLQTLPLVCWRWHDIAYDTPELWRIISVHLDQVVDAVSEASCRAKLATLVRRAKSKLALVVSISRGSDPHHANIAACLDQVAPFLEVLTLGYSTRIAERARWTLPRARNLRQLRWTTTGTSPVFRWPDDIDTFPLLRDVDICIAYEWHDHTGQVAQIFSHCPNLATLELDLDLHSSSPINMELKSLRKLDIRAVGPALVPVLSALRLPALKEVNIDAVTGGDLRDLFSGPLATARSIDIGTGVTIDDALAMCLVHCPQLRHLHLDIDGGDDEYDDLEGFLELMSYPLAGTKEWICPRLLSLRMSGLELNRVAQAILTFAQNRTEPPFEDNAFTGRFHRLKRLAIGLPPEAVVPTLIDYGWLNSTLEGLGLSTSLT